MKENTGKNNLLAVIRELEEVAKSNPCNLSDDEFSCIADAIHAILVNKWNSVVSRESASRILGISTRSFKRIVDKGEIPQGERNGHRELSWRLSDIFAFIKRKRE